MSLPPDILPERVAAMRPAVSATRYGSSLDVKLETDSTNDDAREAALAGAASGHVVVADSQRAGRGSKGRTWSSPAGTDLYLSIVDRPRLALHNLPPMTLAVGLGVAEAVKRCVPARADKGRRTQVKWPNDVWLDGVKVAGILVEASSTGNDLDSLVIGIGLNVNRTQFPAELEGLATSLRLGHPKASQLDRGQVLAITLGCVQGWVDRYIKHGPGPVVAALRANLAMLDWEVTVDGQERGYLRGVAKSGAALIETPSGMEEVLAGRIEAVARPRDHMGALSTEPTALQREQD